MERIKRFFKEEEGVAAIEYGLIAAVIAIGILLAIQGVRDALVDMFGRVVTALS